LGIRFNSPVWWIRGAITIDAIDKQLIISIETDMLETYLPHKEVAKARAAASAIMTEEESCIEASTKREKGGVISVLTIKFSLAGLGAPPGLSGVIATSE
jgi:hypothetical protein